MRSSLIARSGPKWTCSGIAIIGERKAVIRVEPAVVGVATLVGAANLDHDVLPGEIGDGENVWARRADPQSGAGAPDRFANPLNRSWRSEPRASNPRLPAFATRRAYASRIRNGLHAAPAPRAMRTGAAPLFG